MPVTATTSAATEVNSRSAILQGSLTDLGGETSVSVYFEYGLTTAYGSTTDALTLSAIGNFSAKITDFDESTTYHFRAVASDGVTAYNGADESLTTTACFFQLAGVPSLESIYWNWKVIPETAWSTADCGDYSENWSFPHQGQAGYKGPNNMLVISEALTETYQWKTTETDTPNTDSDSDGHANTQAMIAAGIEDHPAAQVCVALGEGWYLLSIDEWTDLILSNGCSDAWDFVATLGLPTTYPERIFWSSRQYSTTEARFKNTRDTGTGITSKITYRGVLPVRKPDAE